MTKGRHTSVHMVVWCFAGTNDATSVTPAIFRVLRVGVRRFPVLALRASWW